MLRRACIVGVLMLCCRCGVAAASSPGVWLDVPFVAQQKDGCGAASIAMVLQYWQRHEDRAGNPNAEYGTIQEALLSRAAHGIYASDMVGYFQRNGFTALPFTGDWDLVRHHLEKGRPLIVALQPGPHRPLHYVVLAGVDREAQVVLVNDPAQRKLLKEDLPSFDREWKAAGRWTLLAVPASGAQ